MPLSDCFSLFMRPARSNAPSTTSVYVNKQFVDEWDQVSLLANLYAVRETPPVAAKGTAADVQHLVSRKLATAARVARTVGLRGVASAVRNRLSDSNDKLRLVAGGAVLARMDPIVRALKAGRCPDCSAPLETDGKAPHCRACATSFVAGQR
jgi:hypothetical protein